MSLLSVFIGLAIVLSTYVIRVNWVLARTPAEALSYTERPLTEEKILQVNKKAVERGLPWPNYLPEKKARRYIVAGGSGFVGGQIVIALIAQGVPPRAIRILDWRAPFRDKFLEKPYSEVQFVQADIRSEATTLEAYEAPWADEKIAKLPLTVFHTIGIIRPQERSPLFWNRVAAINVTGTAHSLSAARTVGASIFIYTSSSSAQVLDVGWFFPPWRSQPENYTQIIDGSDYFDRPLRPDTNFCNNYGRSKALAERLVCEADGQGMRTGTIRPGNAVYGYRDDLVLGRMLMEKWIPTATAPCVQNWVHMVNVAIAQLQLEDALLGPYVDKVAAKPFMVTDDGAPLRFKDVYQIMATLSITGFSWTAPPPLLCIMITYMIEWWSLLDAHYPWVKRWIGEPVDPIDVLQPGTIANSVSLIVKDGEARKRPGEGGFGYTPACGTVEGMCLQVGEWNAWMRERGVVDGK